MNGEEWEWRGRVQRRYRILVPAVMRPLLLASGIRPGALVRVNVYTGLDWVFWIARMPSDWRITVPSVYRQELRPGKIVDVYVELVLEPEEVEKYLRTRS